MFDWVHNNKRIIQVVLALIFLPFAFFGVDSYFRGGELGAEVARVGDHRVTQQEFQQSLRERQEAMRRMLNDAPVDQAILDSPEMRFAALEQIVRERLLLSQAVRNGLAVSDAQLRDVITSQEAFREDGKFSHERYETFLRAQNLTNLTFEARLRRDLLQQPLMDVFGESGFVANAVVDRIVRLSEQTRDVQIAAIAPASFASQVNIEEGAVKAYFDSHAREFELPEQVRIEYVVLSLDNLAAQTEVAPDEVKQAYEQNTARFSSAEEREASHILIPLAAEANAQAEGPAKARAAAKAKADELMKQLRDKPDRFAELARAHSQDTGSAQSGGDLGFLARGTSKKPFDDALFAMKVGEVAGPVETEFGLHIIRLKSIRGGGAKSFDEVRATVESELKRNRSTKRFAEMAEQLHNMTYEQSDSLQPVAEALKLTIQQSPWITRRPVPGSPLGNERFLKAVFSDDVVKNKRNSEVVEVAPGTLLASRLLEHKPAASRAFDEVKADILKRLTDDEARKRAGAEGREALEKLRKGEDVALAWGKPLVVSRVNNQGLAETTMREIFRADASRLPAFGGADDPGAGYQLIRVTKVTDTTEIKQEARKAAAEQLRRIIAQEQLTDYVAAMKRRVEVKIKPELIEKKN